MEDEKEGRVLEKLKGGRKGGGGNVGLWGGGGGGDNMELALRKYIGKWRFVCLKVGMSG